MIAKTARLTLFSTEQHVVLLIILVVGCGYTTYHTAQHRHCSSTLIVAIIFLNINTGEVGRHQIEISCVRRSSGMQAWWAAWLVFLQKMY